MEQPTDERLARIRRLVEEGLMPLMGAVRAAGCDEQTGSIWSWLRRAKDGIRLSDGSTLKLEAARCGARWMTSPAAVLRFIEATTRASEA